MSVTAAQLVFTNVEADRSPVRRRGDQVWLKTPGAFDNAREVQEIAARLSDFKMPQPPSRDPQAHAGWERVQFFATAAGRFVLARSVALTSGDKYNRGGRFHAHALVLEKQEFRRTGSDPFALLDGCTGRWHATPDDSLARGGDWQAGAISAVEIRPGPGTTTAEPLPPPARESGLLPLVRLLLADRVVAVPAPPARVLALARQLFAWLPPKLRERASFDTLSTGLDLGKTPYWLVGAGSPELLRLWRFRSYEMWKPEAGRFDRDPKLDGDPGLFEQWLAARARESDKPPRLDRLRNAWVLSQALDAAQLDGLDLNVLDEDLFGELSVTAAYPKCLAKLVETQIQESLPEALTVAVRPSIEQAVSVHGLVGLRNLQTELTPAKLAATLAKQFAARGAPAPPPDELNSLGQFLDSNSTTLAGNPDALKLRLICRRWRGEWEQLCDELHASALGDEVFRWFVGWALLSLPLRSQVAVGRIHPNAAWVGPLLKCTVPERGAELHHLLEAIAGVSAGFLDEPYMRSPVRLGRDRLHWLIEKLAGPAPVVEEGPDPESATPGPSGDDSTSAEPKTLNLVEEENQEDKQLREQLTGAENRPRAVPSDKEIAEMLRTIKKVKDRGSIPDVTEKLDLIVRRWAGADKSWSELAQFFGRHSFPDPLYVWFAEWSLRSLRFEQEVQVGRLGPDQAWLAPVVSCNDAITARQLQNLVAALLGVYLPAQQTEVIQTVAPAVPDHRRNWILWDLLGRRSQ